MVIGLLLLCTVPTSAPGGTAVVGNETSFHLDSLEVQPLPEIAGLVFGNSTLYVRTDTATIDSASQQVHIVGRVVIEQDQEGISSCTIALGSLKTRQKVLKFSPRFQILTDKEGRFSITVRIVHGDVLLLSWTGELYRIYRIGNLVR